MTLEEAKKHIQTLATKAAAADKADDAMKFSQAATNIANALCGLNSPCMK